MKRNQKLLLGFASLFTLVLILGQIFSYPNTLKDLVTDKFSRDTVLTYPFLYSLFAPFFLFADHLTILSLEQHITFIVTVTVLWLWIRFYLKSGSSFGIKLILKEIGFLFLFEGFITLLYAAVILVPRPMAALKAQDPDTIVVDFHTHTQNSWDARKSFSIQKNLNWHAGAGFHSAFITDHNVFPELVPLDHKGVKALHGEEVSLYRSHWVLLGNRAVVPNQPYDDGLGGIEKFVREMKSVTPRVVIASLPEYWFYHWGDSLEKFVDWGIDGFEIANSAPLALDFPIEFRQAIIHLARKRNLVVTGISDNHGWGSTCYVWNLMKIPNWRSLSSSDLEQTILNQINREKFNAVKVLVRVKHEARPFGARHYLDSFFQIGEVCKSLSWQLAAITLLWIWIPLVFILKFSIKNKNES